MRWYLWAFDYGEGKLLITRASGRGFADKIGKQKRIRLENSVPTCAAKLYDQNHSPGWLDRCPVAGWHPEALTPTDLW